MEKFYRAGQATDDNKAHAHCMLDTYGYRQAFRICNTYCFSTSTVVASACPVATSHMYVYCLSCYLLSPFIYAITAAINMNGVLEDTTKYHKSEYMKGK